MKLKVGDKLLCKKNSVWLTRFYKDKYYTITHVMQQVRNESVYCIVWVTKNGDYFTTLENHTSTPFLWEDFYTPKELRKLKLDKISEV